MINKTYSKFDISIVIPTKDRPSQVDSLLSSLALQSDSSFVDEIIVVASGEKIDDVIEKYNGELPLTYIHSAEPGQIRQRNLGLSNLRCQSSFIGLFDDDLVLAPRALASVAKFIAEKRSEDISHIGIGLNIVNAYGYYDLPRKSIKRAFLQIGPSPGTISKAGVNTTISNVGQTISTEWLGGGYTIWSRNIIDRYPHTVTHTRYAAAEDLIYSYPIGRQFPLFICADAQATLTEVFDVRSNTRYLNKKTTIAHLYFCRQHKDFSGCLYAILRLIYLFPKLFTLRKSECEKFLGSLSGVIYFIINRKKGRTILSD